MILVFLQILLPYHVFAEGTYECGDHGRFEYCIDEIPGCVIGCHCHPGYYFDTDTKICEPNTRLIERHRRLNVIEPARVQKIDVTPNVIYDTEPTSSTNKIDERVDEIAKDVNDLGDWLYNQFFKTIENQVINNTDAKDTLTRRSGLQSRNNDSKKKKIWRKGKRSSKKKSKKEHLRRKLLRITENDSLFDISSKSISDSSDASSSDSSFEYESKEHHKHDDNEHGHKKIVMINKKPKQQLPSFIFLPNLDTPFYPPIGLPPPPIMPMYPMIPVPPVPLCPTPGGENVNNHQGTTTTTSSTVISSTTIPTIITSITSVDLETTTAVEETTDSTVATIDHSSNIKSLRQKNKKKKLVPKLLNNYRAHAKQGLKAINREKILQRLKEKMSDPNKIFMPTWKNNEKILANTFHDQNIDVETNFHDNGLVDAEYMDNEIQPKNMQDNSAFPNNIDFKYITELIHRIDLSNKSNDLPPIEYNPQDSLEVYRPSKVPKNQFADYTVPLNTPDGRRYSHPVSHRSDESYYANLGRHIATMIRGTDKQNGQVAAELEGTPSKIKIERYFSNNSPMSFWERFVRSPLSVLNANNKKIEYLKRSNELLFDIENKVEIIASTAPALSLQEIENIVNVMEATNKEIYTNVKKTQHEKRKIRMKNTGTLNNNLNIDLWPQMKNSVNALSPLLIKNSEEKSSDHFNVNRYKTHGNNFPSVHMHSIKKFVAWNGQNFNERLKSSNLTSDVQTTATPLNNNRFIDKTNYNLQRLNRNQQISAKTNAFSQHSVNQPYLNKQMTPLFLNRRRYFQDDINQNEVPLRLPAMKLAGLQPSYFHHEINHFDYME